jgi:hypothetical protein
VRVRTSRLARLLHESANELRDVVRGRVERDELNKRIVYLGFTRFSIVTMRAVKIQLQEPT